MKANPQIKMMRTGKSSAAGGQRSATGPLASFCVGQNPARSGLSRQIKAHAQRVRIAPQVRPHRAAQEHSLQSGAEAPGVFTSAVASTSPFSVEQRTQSDM